MLSDTPIVSPARRRYPPVFRPGSARCTSGDCVMSSTSAEFDGLVAVEVDEQPVTAAAGEDALAAVDGRRHGVGGAERREERCHDEGDRQDREHGTSRRADDTTYRRLHRDRSGQPQPAHEVRQAMAAGTKVGRDQCVDRLHAHRAPDRIHACHEGHDQAEHCGAREESELERGLPDRQWRTVADDGEHPGRDRPTRGDAERDPDDRDLGREEQGADRDLGRRDAQRHRDPDVTPLCFDDSLREVEDCEPGAGKDEQREHVEEVLLALDLVIERTHRRFIGSRGDRECDVRAGSSRARAGGARVVRSTSAPGRNTCDRIVDLAVGVAPDLLREGHRGEQHRPGRLALDRLTRRRVEVQDTRARERVRRSRTSTPPTRRVPVAGRWCCRAKCASSNATSVSARVRSRPAVTCQRSIRGPRPEVDADNLARRRDVRLAVRGRRGREDDQTGFDPIDRDCRPRPRWRRPGSPGRGSDRSTSETRTSCADSRE